MKQCIQVRRIRLPKGIFKLLSGYMLQQGYNFHNILATNNPIIVIKETNGYFMAIDQIKRLVAAKILKIKTLECMVL